MTFYTHEFIKELKNGGFSEEQAEIITKLKKAAVVQPLSRRDMIMNENLVTNHSLDSRYRESDLKSKVRLAETKSKLIRWIDSVGLLQTALITALLIKLNAVV
jgi:hypothetical protein